MAIPVQDAEVGLRGGIALLGRLVRPFRRLGIVLLDAARAIETETYVCASAQTGSFTVGNEQRHTYGHSLVADPWGHLVARASDGPGVVSARIDPERVKQVRAMIPVAEHRARIARE